MNFVQALAWRAMNVPMAVWRRCKAISKAWSARHNVRWRCTVANLAQQFSRHLGIGQRRCAWRCGLW
jgi:hypothetical protein